MIYSDDILMAYADGELPADQMAAVAAAAQDDPAIAARIDLFRQSRSAVAAALALPPRQDAGSDPIAALVRKLDQAPQPQTQPQMQSGTVIPLPPRRTVPMWQLAAAASIAFAVGLSFALSGTGPATTDLAALMIATPDSLGQALDTLPAGTRQAVAGAEIEVIASFTTADGTFCREFEVDAPDDRTVVSVACRDGATWDLRLAIAAVSDTGGYAPASSLDALDAWLVATDASEPMSVAQEALALRSFQ
jgi:anti-sigma factor RsiW